MENNKKISTVFGLAVIAMLVAALFIVNNIDSTILAYNDRESQKALSFVVQHKNLKIRMLAKELEQARLNLTELQTDLGNVNQKITGMAEAATQAVAVAEGAVSESPVASVVAAAK